MIGADAVLDRAFAFRVNLLAWLLMSLVFGGCGNPPASNPVAELPKLEPLARGPAQRDSSRRAIDPAVRAQVILDGSDGAEPVTIRRGDAVSLRGEIATTGEPFPEAPARVALAGIRDDDVLPTGPGWTSSNAGLRLMVSFVARSATPGLATATPPVPLLTRSSSDHQKIAFYGKVPAPDVAGDWDLEIIGYDPRQDHQGSPKPEMESFQTRPYARCAVRVE
jgi:hypothetical protein